MLINQTATELVKFTVKDLEEVLNLKDAEIERHQKSIEESNYNISEAKLEIKQALRYLKQLRAIVGE